MGYGKGNHECTNHAIENLDWQKAFLNINLHTQVILFNEILTNNSELCSKQTNICY